MGTPSGTASDDPSWYEELDGFEWILLIGGAAYVAYVTVANGNNHPAFALLVAFPGFCFVFYCWYLMIKFLLLILFEEAAAKVIAKIAEAATLAIVGIFVGKIFE